jgi:hypothetical protein
MPGIGRRCLAFGCVTVLGIFFRSIFDISSLYCSDFANQSGNGRERQPQKAVAANLSDGKSLTIHLRLAVN